MRSAKHVVLGDVLLAAAPLDQREEIVTRGPQREDACRRQHLHRVRAVALRVDQVVLLPDPDQGSRDEEHHERGGRGDDREVQDAVRPHEQEPLQGREERERHDGGDDQEHHVRGRGPHAVRVVELIGRMPVEQRRLREDLVAA